MFVKLLKSKLHRARVTEAKLHYPGSIAIDWALIATAGILPYESVLVADVNNGNRLVSHNMEICEFSICDWVAASKPEALGMVGKSHPQAALEAATLFQSTHKFTWNDVLETYVVPAEAGCGEIVILGAAAHLIKPKDIVIILGFGYMTPEEAKDFEPKIVILNENNEIVK